MIFIAELVAHSDRMNRHVQGVVESIHEHRDTISTLADQLSKMVKQFQGSGTCLIN